VLPLSNGPSDCRFVAFFFKLDDHVVKDKATSNPMQSDLEILLGLYRVTKLLERLETPLQSSKCVLNTDTDLDKLKIN
jgi:hypothetical protein